MPCILLFFPSIHLTMMESVTPTRLVSWLVETLRWARTQGICFTAKMAQSDVMIKGAVMIDKYLLS